MNLFLPILIGRSAFPLLSAFSFVKVKLELTHTTEAPKDSCQVLPPFFNPGSAISLKKNADSLKCCTSYQTQEDSARSAAVVHQDGGKGICVLYDGLPCLASPGSKEPACNAGDPGSILGRERQPTPVFLPGKFHGQILWNRESHKFMKIHTVMILRRTENAGLITLDFL